jgi:uncharacterized protein YqjF (DUF2071 family)
MNWHDMNPLDRPILDRLAPAQRPDGAVVMRPAWNHLLFLHWPVTPDALQRLLPRGVEIDTFEGRAWVGLVPFTMRRVRPHWAPAVGRQWYENFHETNVRTYVHCNGEPGVWFFSLDAANLPAVLAARAWYKLPYFHARMKMEQEENVLRFQSQRLRPRPLPATCAVSARVESEIFRAAPNTLEHFLVERYILFSQARGQIFRGRVHHLPYLLQRAQTLQCEENLVLAAGLTRPHTEPHTLYSQGVDVEIFGLERVA